MIMVIYLSSTGYVVTVELL